MGPNVRRLSFYIQSGQQPLLFMFQIIILILICLDFASYSCLVGFVVLFSTRVFLIGDPYLTHKEGEVLWNKFPHSDILAKLPPSATSQFLFRAGLCCRVQQRRITQSQFWACFSVERQPIHQRIIKEGSWEYFHIFGIRPTIYHPSQRSDISELRYFWRQLLGGFIELIRRVYFLVEGSTFIQKYYCKRTSSFHIYHSLILFKSILQ